MAAFFVEMVGDSLLVEMVGGSLLVGMPGWQFCWLKSVGWQFVC